MVARGFNVSSKLRRILQKLRCWWNLSQSRNAREASAWKKRDTDGQWKEPQARGTSGCDRDTNQGSCSLISRNWSECRQEVQAQLCRGPCCSRRTRTDNSFPCSFPRRGELVPYMEWRWGRARGWLGWLACPLSVLRAGGMHSALLLRLAPQKWQWLKESKDLDNWRNIPGLGIRKTQYSQNHNSP